MKRLLGLSLGLCLTLLTAGNALAAVHNFTSDFSNPFHQSSYDSPSFEGWYYIEKDDPSATVRGSLADSHNQIGSEYFLNDQTFANLTYYDPDPGDSSLGLKGSYLFANNVFVGLDLNSQDSDTQIIVSPGYRFNLDKDAYVAVSMDYALNDKSVIDSGIADFEVNGRYYNQVSRVYGQIIIPNEDVVGTDKTFLRAGGAYKYNDNVVLGADFTQREGNSTFEIGCTTAFDKLGAELRFISIEKANDAIDCNVLYSFTAQIRAGLQLTDEDRDDLRLIAKGKYKVNDKNSIILMQQFENDSYESVTHLRWDIALK